MEQSTVRLYDGAAPGSEDVNRTEVEYSAWGATSVRNVVDPSLTEFLPDPATATGAAVVVAPGGGFCMLSWETEGTMVGEWLRDHGIAAFVLKYRTADMGGTEADFDAKSSEVIDAMLALARVDDPAEVRRATYPALSRVVELAEDDARQALRHVRDHAGQYGVLPYRMASWGSPLEGSWLWA